MHIVVGVVVCLTLTLAACTGSGTPQTKPAVTVKMGHLDPPSIGLAPMLIAEEKGYFAELGVTLESVGFANTPDIAAPLSANQLDAGLLGVNAGLFNAFNRGIKVVIAADGGSSRPGFDYTAIVVRKALLDSGRFKTAADFRGLRVSIPSKGTPADYGFAQLLQPVGLSLADVDLQTLGFPTMLAALLGGGVDAGWEIEPFLTQSLESGGTVVFKHGEEFVPGAQLAVLALSSQFASTPDAASRYLAGWIKGARLYNDAFGKKDPKAREDVFAILKKRIPNMTDALLDKVVPSGIDPDGKVNIASLESEQAFFLATGSQEQALDVKQLADAQYSQEAVKLLGGPYR